MEVGREIRIGRRERDTKEGERYWRQEKKK